MGQPVYGMFFLYNFHSWKKTKCLSVNNNYEQVLGAGEGHVARWLTVSHHNKILCAFDTTLKIEYNQGQTEIVSCGGLRKRFSRLVFLPQQNPP